MLNALTAWVLTSPALGDLVLAGVSNPDPVAPPGLKEPVEMFLGWLKWVAITAGVGGLIICGIKMMAGRQNRSNLAADGAAGVPWVLLGLSLVALAAGLVDAVI